MRTPRIVLLAAGLLVLEAMPAGAVYPGFVSFTIDPIGGPAGTTIAVNGQCGGATEGDAVLQHPPASDAVPPPEDQQHFTVDTGNNNTFSATLHVSHSPTNGFPLDTEVVVTCGPNRAVHPFQESTMAAGTGPTIFASIGPTPCGFANVAPPADNRVPCPEHIKGFNASGQIATTNLYRNFNDSHGASVAIGDVDGDGQPDLVTGSGPGAPGNVLVSKLDGTPIAAAYVYGDFAGGVNVAVGDVDGDGHNEIVTGAGPGGGPHVLVLAYDQATNSLSQIDSFYAYDPNFHGGVNVAAATGRIVTGAGAGGGPHVKVLDATGNAITGFYAYDPAFTGGVSVAVDPADGDIVTGAGPGGGPHVRVFTANGTLANTGWYAYDPHFSGGVSVGVGRVGGGTEQIVTGAGPGGGPHVRVFNTDGTLVNGGWYAFEQVGPGVRVAVAP